MTGNADRADAQSNVEAAVGRFGDQVKAVGGLWSYNTPQCLNGLKGSTKLGQVKVFGFDEEEDTLNAIGFTRWLDCLDRALRKSNLTRKDVGYLNILHFKPSMHAALLDTLGLKEEQSFYLKDYGHLGQVDPILSIHHGLQTGRLKDGQVMAILTAGIGYVWGVSLVRWG